MPDISTPKGMFHNLADGEIFTLDPNLVLRRVGCRDAEGIALSLNLQTVLCRLPIEDQEDDAELYLSELSEAISLVTNLPQLFRGFVLFKIEFQNAYLKDLIASHLNTILDEYQESGDSAVLDTLSDKRWREWDLLTFRVALQ